MLLEPDLFNDWSKTAEKMVSLAANNWWKNEKQGKQLETSCCLVGFPRFLGSGQSFGSGQPLAVRNCLLAGQRDEIVGIVRHRG
jgi:hypothetical protein